MSFSIGDSVRVRNEFMGTVDYGPYRAASSGPERYMVQKEDGMVASVIASELTAHMTFTAGEEAEEIGMGRKVTVVAGPFDGLAGTDHYVVQRKVTGRHTWVPAGALKRVTPAPLDAVQKAVRRLNDDMQRAGSIFTAPIRSFLYKGRTYSLDAEYQDRQGDVWKFNGKRSANGMPHFDCTLYTALHDVEFGSAVDQYGPFSRA